MTDPTLDAHAIAVMVSILAALALFMHDRVPLETTALLILIGLVLGFELFPYETADGRVETADFFAGFGHEALVTICALMIVGRSLEATGALEPLAHVMVRTWKTHPSMSLLGMLITTAVLSAFVNNTPIVVMLMPILVSVCVRTGTSATGVLMPMGLATLLGGSGTTIGTSTNLLVVLVAVDLGMRRFSMFDFTVPALLSGVVGIAYLWLVAPRLLPGRTRPMIGADPMLYEATLHVEDDSFAADKTLAEVLRRTDNKMKVIDIQRGADLMLVRLPTLVVRTGDRLHVLDSRENLKAYESALGARLHDFFDSEHPVSDEHPLTAAGQQLAEVVVREGSFLAGETLKRTRFAEEYQLVVLAIHRAGGSGAIRSDLADRVLQPGDVLLVQGPSESIHAMKQRNALLVLDGTVDLPHTAKAPVAIAIFIAVVATAGLGILPISVSALAGVGLVVLTGCLSWRATAGALSTSVIMIIVASLALGVALTRTGGADYLAHVLVSAAAGYSPAAVMSALMLLMAVLSNLVSHNAAAVIGTPIAIAIANDLGVAPEAFVLAVLFGANMGYATPIAYQTNALILNAGGYRFTDFVRVGLPLVLLMWVTLSFLLPVLYPIE